MRPGSDLLKQVLTGSMDIHYEADLFYGNTRRFERLPIDGPSLSWDGTADVEGEGSCTVVWNDAQGSSLVPNDPQDWLAPYGAQLVIYAVVKASESTFSERVQLGVFTITAIPGSDEGPFIVGETKVVVGSRIQVQFKDRMVEVQGDQFTQLASPSQLLSVYAELGWLTGFVVKKLIADSAITTSVVYQQDRIKALQDVAGNANGIAFCDYDGTITMRPVVPGTPVAALTIGEQGTIAPAGAKPSLSRDEVYNGIVITGETSDTQAVLAVKWIEQGPLRATPEGGQRTPFHRKPRFHSSPFITTTEQAQDAAPGLLDTFSKPRAAQLQIQCLTNPLLQVGDVVTAFDGIATWRVRIARIDLGLGAYMTIVADVIDRVIG
jgi:hypothetical protein